MKSNKLDKKWNANCHKTFMIQEGRDEYILFNQPTINLCSLTSLFELITQDNYPSLLSFKKSFFVAYISQEIPQNADSSISLFSHYLFYF